MIRRLKQPNTYLFLVTVMVGLGGLVVVEPAPYDLLMALLFPLALVVGYLTFPKRIVVPASLAVIFIVVNVVTIPGAVGQDAAIRYGAITLYLILSCVFFMGLLERFGASALHSITAGYACGAAVSAALGVLGVARVVPFWEQFVYGGVRAEGLFKDPNVFGPYLVPVAVLSIQRASVSSGVSRFLWVLLSSLTTAGIVLSMSRGAWVNLAIAGVVYFLFRAEASYWRKLTTSLGVAVLTLIMLIYPLSNMKVSAILVSRIGIQSYDMDRFATQARALQGTDPTNVDSSEPEPAPQGAEVATEGPSTVVEEKVKTPEEPDTGAGEPGTAAEEPGTAVEEPGTAAEEPGTAAEEPGTAAEEPGTAAEEPGTAAGEPGTAAEEPGTVVGRDDHWLKKLVIGIGPGQANLALGRATHSLYIRALIENGYLGFLALVALMAVSLARTIRCALKTNGWVRNHYVLVTSCLLGLFANSLVIDSIHWRHLWLLLALAWFQNDGRTAIRL